MSLATAAAASSCFPSLFGPLRLPFKAEELSGGSHRSTCGDYLHDRVELSDGGVYDNPAPTHTLVAELTVWE